MRGSRAADSRTATVCPVTDDRQPQRRDPGRAAAGTRWPDTSRASGPSRAGQSSRVPHRAPHLSCPAASLTTPTAQPRRDRRAPGWHVPVLGISPKLVATMLEGQLAVQPGQRILEIGAATGSTPPSSRAHRPGGHRRDHRARRRPGRRGAANLSRAGLPGRARGLHRRRPRRPQPGPVRPDHRHRRGMGPRASLVGPSHPGRAHRRPRPPARQRPHPVHRLPPHRTGHAGLPTRRRICGFVPMRGISEQATSASS